MDLFMEHIVKHKRTGKDYGIIAGIVILGAILLYFSQIMLAIQFLATLWLLVAVGIIFFVVVFIKRTDVEFEYILTNNELDIDRITAKSSRKRVFNVDFSTVDICAPVSAYKSEFEKPAYKTFDFTGSGEGEVYFIDIPSESGKKRILIEPPTEFIESARKYNPSRIFVA